MCPRPGNAERAVQGVPGGRHEAQPPLGKGSGELPGSTLVVSLRKRPPHPTADGGSGRGQQRLPAG